MVRRLLRALRIPALVLLGAILLLGLLWLLRVPLFGGFLKDTIATRLGESLGGRYRIEGIGGSWIADLEIRGLSTVEAPATGPVTGLAADRAVARYRLLGLLGSDPLAAVQSVRLDGGRLDLDLRRPPDPTTDEIDLDFIERLRTRVDATADIRIETDQGPIDVTGLEIGFGADVGLRLRAADLRLPDRFEVHGPLAGQVRSTGPRTWQWTSEAAFGEVRIPEVTFTLDGDVEGRVEVAQGRIDFRRTGDQVTATARDLNLGALPAWVTDLAPADLPLPTAGRLGADANLRLSDPLALTVRGAVEDLLWRGEPIRRVEAQLTWAGGPELTIERCDIKADQAIAHLSGAVLDPRLPFLLRDVEKLSVELRSTLAYLPELERDLAVVLHASSRGDRQIDIDKLLIADAGLRLEARGSATLPEVLEDWPATQIEIEIEGGFSDLTPLEARFEGFALLRGKLLGALDALRVSATVVGRDATLEGRRVDRCEARGVLVWPELELETVEVESAAARGRASGRVVLDPVSVPEAEVSLDVSDLAGVAALLPADVPPLAGRLQVDGRLRYEEDRLDLTLRAEGEELVVDDLAVGRVQARVRPDGDRIVIEAFDAEGSWGRLRSAADVYFAEKKAEIHGVVVESDALDVRLRRPLAISWTEDAVDLEDLDLDADGTRVRAALRLHPKAERIDLRALSVLANGTHVRAAAPFAVSWAGGVVDVPPFDGTVGDETTFRAAFRVEPDAKTATLRELSARGSFGEARLHAPLRLGMDDDVIDVRGLDASVGDVRVTQGAGRVRPEAGEAVLDALLVRAADVEGRLRAPARIRWGDDGVDVSDIDVEMFGGRIRGRVAYDGEDLRALLEGSGFALSRFVAAVEGDLAFRLRAADGKAALEARVPELRVGKWAGEAKLDAHQGAGGPIVLDRLRITGPEKRSVLGRAVIPYRLGSQGLRGLADVAPSMRLQGSLGGLEAFSELLGGPVHVDATGDAAGARVRLRFDDLGLCDEQQICDDGLVEVHVTPAATAATASLASDQFARLRAEARVDRGLDWARPGADLAAFLDGNLDADVDALVRSWKPLAREAEFLVRLEGAVGVRLRARGPLRDPRVRGDITLSDVSFAADSDIAPFEKVNARLVWADRVLRIERFEGLMGYAPFRLGGSIDVGFDRLPVLDLRLHGENMQLLRTDYLRMRIDVDAAIKGSVDQLHFEGRGEIVDMIFRKPVTLAAAGSAGGTPEIVLFEIDDEPFTNITFDLDVKADNSIRIRNNFLRMNVSFEGALKGTGSRPEFNGRAWFQNGEVFLPVTTLRKADGEITFSSDAPFRPRIQMTAQTRTRGYELGVQLSGSLPDVSLNVFSEPRLDEEDAILMLTTGSTGAELAQGGIFGQALSVIVNAFGGSLFTTRGGDGEPGEKAFFERFDFTSEWQGASITSIAGEIELTDKFFLVLEQDRHDATNLGVLWRLRFR